MSIYVSLLCAVSVAHLSGACAASGAGFPAPRWWEQGGQTIRGVWPKCALGEGLAEAGQMRGLPAFMVSPPQRFQPAAAELIAHNGFNLSLPS